MKVLLLADPDSSHTIKWARSLSQQGLEIGIFSFSSYNSELYLNNPNIRIFKGGIDRALCSNSFSGFRKISYLKAFPRLLASIREFNPDVLHSHYVSSNGLLGLLSGFRPHVVSVWGTDIFEFPSQSFLHKFIIKLCLKRSNKILSTSNVMAVEVKKYTNRPVSVTPFGIDLDLFKKTEGESNFFPGDIVIGTVKTLELNYGVEYLIRAFHLVKLAHPDLPLKLLLVGGGSLHDQLKAVVSELGLENCTFFTGPVPYDDVVKYHNMLTISVSVSLRESFGVAVIEASACEKPVIVSNVGGLPEVVEDGVTGYIVPPKNIRKTSIALEKLVLNPELRSKMGRAGRERVKKLFDWKQNVRQMIGIYNNVVKSREVLEIG